MEKSRNKHHTASKSKDKKGLHSSKRGLFMLGFYLKISLLILLSGQIGFTILSDITKEPIENTTSDSDSGDHSSEGEDLHDFEKDKICTDYESSCDTVLTVQSFPAICTSPDAGYLSMHLTPPEYC